MAGKGQKNLEIYQRKQYLKAQLGCYKTALYVHKEEHQNIYFLQNFLGMTCLLATSIFVF